MIPARRIHPSLPLFRLHLGEQDVIYAPGHLAVVSAAQAQSLARAWTRRRPALGSDLAQLGSRLESIGRRVVGNWQRRLSEPFAPECLTIHLSQQCNLSCRYCFSSSLRRDPVTPDPGPLPEEAISAAARLVARCCAERGTAFHLVLHGGGEPTVQPRLVKRIVELTRTVASRHALRWYGYVATNGVLPRERARWLAENFDLVGLSCDGPPDVQDRQRPRAGGGGSSRDVERTARILVAAGGRFNVRATITRDTVERQAEIVRYLGERLGATEIRFEAAYLVGGSESLGFVPADAERFVEHFLAAERQARACGCSLRLSGSRLDELHGPYCNLLQNVLLLTPDGSVTACFLGSQSSAATVIGRWQKDSGELVLDSDRILALRRMAGAIPARCRDCLNAYHCARGCPEVCPPASAESHSGAADPGAAAAGFRCLVQRRLAENWISHAAKPLLAASGTRRRPPAEPPGDDRKRVRRLLRELPVDPEPIVHQWQAARGQLSIAAATLPLPVWAYRGFEHRGFEAWERLKRDLPDTRHNRALSVYVHVPFCDRRCGFCNSYSVVAGTRTRQRPEAYTQVLTAEIGTWSGVDALRDRPVTTVHFGGGTPNCLRPELFARIIDCCRSSLGVSAETEWALESTSSLLTDEHLAQLRRWGFTRLHVGVQTLEDPVRRLIGRRELGDAVVGKLARALALGFVVSVDVMYGLPTQSPADLVATLEQLTRVGLHGFSVYGLHVTPRNRRFLERHQAARRNPLHDYLCFQAAEQVLLRKGYRKTHFTHFALPQDTNLYYSHPERGEDLLALGPTADGAFGPYHYRHPDLPEYLAGPLPGPPVLEGGVRESALEQRLRPVSVELMAGSVRHETLRRLGAEALLDAWREWALVEDGPNRDRCGLTANGSWFVNEMLNQVSEWVAGDGPGASAGRDR